MKNYTLVVLLVILCSAFKGNEIKTTIKDFKPAFGQWKGSLTYLDYKSGKPYTMPVNATISENITDDHQLIIAYEYPNEPKANGNDTLVIGKQNTQINKAKLVSKKTLPNGTLEIISEENGKDGNDHKSGILKRTYIIGENVFSIRKDVQFEGDTKWIQRDIYSFVR